VIYALSGFPSFLSQSQCPVSALTSDRDRRGAQRLALPKRVPATLGGFAGTIVEFSLTGCRFDHVDRVALRASLPFRFSWRGASVRITATVVRSEMSTVGGRPAYSSGLEFCESVDDSPEVVRDVMAWLVDDAAKKSGAKVTQPVSAPALRVDDDEPEILSASYLQCTFHGGTWMKLYVEEPKQPGNGFTIPTPSDESEVDVLCRAYQNGGAEARRAMRESFELAIARKRSGTI
jgi:hypothetical protein